MIFHSSRVCSRGRTLPSTSEPVAVNKNSRSVVEKWEYFKSIWKDPCVEAGGKEKPSSKSQLSRGTLGKGRNADKMRPVMDGLQNEA